MPYIKRERRGALTDAGESDYPRSSGELNFLITRCVLDYIIRGGCLNYQRINDVLGALDGAKLEFYRRVVVPYEDTKIKENGDIYPCI